MINEKQMDEILDGFEDVVKKAGVECIRVTCKNDFLRKIFEHGMQYDGFVIVDSEIRTGIFYIDTRELPSGIPKKQDKGRVHHISDYLSPVTTMFSADAEETLLN